MVKVAESVWKKLFSIDKDGVFTITEFSREYSNYKVFISPYNNHKWGSLTTDQDNYLADISFMSSDFVPPNMAPFFDQEPTAPELNTGMTGMIEYVLPKVLDAQNDEVIVTAEDLEEFISLDDAEKVMIFNMSKASAGNFTVIFILTDAQGGVSQVGMDLEVKQAQDKIEFVPVFEDDEVELE